MEQKDYRNMIKELLDLDSSLSAWEITVIDDLNRWTGNYTQPQMNLIEKIWNKHF
jgi:hypothetical protein